MTTGKRRAIYFAVGIQNGYNVDWEDGTFYKEQAPEEEDEE